ncbi:histidine phosphatase family protein [Cellulomonas sp. KRMCY2]|uniref:SixA phosphatase family protein n=1 Tax=Cellulomonas sp. KRMCY2 TaxID=1304865 RepID=UPI00045E6E69|nr:histidine phosphatase family protein [Cellulomonas sp. KRMCY2]
MTPGAARPGGRRLILLRHAKAEPSGGVPDALRPLALLGRRQCSAVAASLVASGLLPEHVLVSSAVRTRQTWELVRAALGDVPAAEVEVTDRVYDAGPHDLIELARGLDERIATLLVVGHEPTMSSTAALLARADGDSVHLAQVRTGIPTGAFAVLDVETWTGLARGTATLLDVVRPPR